MHGCLSVVFSSLFCCIAAISHHGSFGDDGLYKITIEKKPKPVSIPANPTENEVPLTVPMFNRRGQGFLCSLPVQMNSSVKHHQFNLTNQDMKAALVAGDPKRPTTRDCVRMLSNGWWHYEYCFSSTISQFHIEGEQITDPILSLGKFSHDFDWSQVSEQDALKKTDRFHTQYFTNGTECDLTGKRRSTRVKLYCNANSAVPTKDHIVKVDEPESCVYELTVLTSRICHIDYFYRQPSPVGKITCNPLPSTENTGGQLRVIDSSSGEPREDNETDLEEAKSEGEAVTKVPENYFEKSRKPAKDQKLKRPAYKDSLTRPQPPSKSPNRTPKNALKSSTRSLSFRQRALLSRLRAPPKTPAKTLHDVLAEMSPAHRRMGEIQDLIAKHLNGAGSGILELAVVDVPTDEEEDGENEATTIQDVLEHLSAENVAKFQAFFAKAVTGQMGIELRDQEAVFLQEDNYNQDSEEGEGNSGEEMEFFQDIEFDV